jgi:hypothetical protein
MSATSAIEWTNATWNPVTGCDKVSPGCAHCYAETFAERWRGLPNHPYEQGFDLRFWPERLELPLTWRKPRMIFVNSMSDLFHDQVPLDYIARVFDTMDSRPSWASGTRAQPRRSTSTSSTARRQTTRPARRCSQPWISKARPGRRSYYLPMSAAAKLSAASSTDETVILIPCRVSTGLRSVGRRRITSSGRPNSEPSQIAR